MLSTLKGDINIIHYEFAISKCESITALIKNATKDSKLLNRCDYIISMIHLIQNNNNAFSTSNILLDCEKLLYLIFHRDYTNYFDSNGGIIFDYDSMNSDILQCIN